ncbi:hypothetical protein ACOMHN_034792 [Nucella lapillus]
MVQTEGATESFSPTTLGSRPLIGPGMEQGTNHTEDQHIFIHDALLEAVQCGNTQVPTRPQPGHPQHPETHPARARGHRHRHGAGVQAAG